MIQRPAPSKNPRPRDAARTREALIDAATDVFNDSGYFNTDSNVIARQAGYSPATFYKHFVDKKAVFLAVHERFVSAVMSLVESSLLLRDPQKSASALVHALIDHHREWRVFRASLRALIVTDPEIREAHRVHRNRQLAGFDPMRREWGFLSDRERDAELVFLLERCCDALADGESESLGLDRKRFIANLERRVVESLSPPTKRG